MSWARCLHPGRPDDCHCEGCPLRWETEATAFRSCLIDGARGRFAGEEPKGGEPRDGASDRP